MDWNASFDLPRTISSPEELHAVVGCGMIEMGENATITLCGLVTIEPGVVFAGHCSITDGCVIGRGSVLTDVVLGPSSRVRPYSILSNLTAGARNLFGPFCFIRDGCFVGDDCILGAHVEAARSQFGSGVKVSHRAFIGDAVIGDETIIGAGVVFCNYDGTHRQLTTVGGRVTIGSGSVVVPPLSIGEHAFIAAGSAVTKNVRAGTRVIQKRQE